MSLKPAAYFYAVKRNINDRNRVGHWKQPKASLYEPDSAKCGHFYLFVKIHRVMSNEEIERKQTEQKAAHMLMVEFVKSNADLMATVLEPIVATWGEVTYATLKDNMGVVSQVFAGVALELIDHNSSLDPEDCDNMVLPVGAKTMNSTIEELSKFISAVRLLFVLFIDKNLNHPAIDMVRKAFYKYEAQM